MSTPVLETTRLRLVLETADAILARIDAMSPEDQAQVSPEWVARMRNSTPSPWTHGFAMVERATGAVVGTCAFKGPPDSEGVVEIAYAVESEFRRRGYAKEAAAGLVEFALASKDVRRVRAHTLPGNGASTRVLQACGFSHVGDVVDPEDGPVWRWELVSSTRRGQQADG